MQNFTRKSLHNLLLLSLSTVLVACERLKMPQADELLSNFGRQLPIIYGIISSTAFFIGMVLITRAIFKLKIYGEMRSMMSPHAKMSQILILFGVGSALMYLPSVFPLAMDAVFGSTTLMPLAYDQNVPFLGHVTESAKQLVRFIGYISFVRGLIQLVGVQEGGGRHTFGKAIVHMIAGVFAVNIQQTIELLEASFGIV